jgi:hypothetical protein
MIEHLKKLVPKNLGYFSLQAEFCKCESLSLYAVLALTL